MADSEETHHRYASEQKTLDPVEVCTQRVRAAPEVYASSRCFVLLVRKARWRRPQVLARLHELQIDFPEHPFIGVVFAEFLARRQPQQAQLYLEEARLKFLLRGHEDGVVIADSRLYLFHRRNRQDAQAQARLDRLHESLHKAKDPLARQRATVFWARPHLIRQVQIGRAARYLARYDDLPTLDLPYFLQEQLHKARGLALMHYRRYHLARVEYAKVETLARAHQDLTTLALAKFGQSLTHVQEVDAEPSERGRVAAELAVRSALTVAQQYGVRTLLGPSRRNLVWLLSGDPARTQEARALAEDALVDEQKGHSTKGIATSYATQSQVLLDTQPWMALNLASYAVGQGGSERRPLSTLFAWRQWTRALQRVASPHDAKWVALTLLEQIEDDRQAQSEQRARRELFASRIPDYDLTIGHLFASPDAQDHELAFQLMERSRARGLDDRWGARACAPRSQVDPFFSAQTNFYLNGSYAAGDVETQLAPKIEAMAKWVRDRIRARGDLRIAQIQSALDSDQAMLAFHLVPASTIEGDRLGPSHVVVITKERWFILPMSLRPGELREQLGLYRSAVEDRTPFAQAIEAQIKAQLLDRVFAVLPETIHKLVVLADDPLPALSFNGVDPEHQWTRAPSAAAWLLLRRRERSLGLINALAVVDPHLDDPARAAEDSASGLQGTRAPIPYSRRELSAIRDALPDVKLVSLSGRDASYERLRSEWRSGSNLLHVSAHTRWRPGAPEMTAIALSPGQSGDDSQWTLAAIEQQDYVGAVVVLGGCATAFGPSVPGEGTLSLADAFLSAGASAVLGSLWPVRDEEAARFFDHFYRQWGQGQTLGQALAQTQAHFRAQGEPSAMYSGYMVSGNAEITAARPPRTSLWRL